MKYLPFTLTFFLLVASLTVSEAADKKKVEPPLPAPTLRDEAPPVLTTGTYKDADGGAHPWRITDTHALVWEEKPYLPVGGAFTPHFWADGQTPEAWAADKAALQTLKMHGVLDLYLYAGDKGLTQVPADAVQKVIDYLDSNRFRYGLEIADFPNDPLVGYVVRPSVYRDPAPSGVSRFNQIPGLIGGLYMVASARDTDIAIVDTGAARITGGDTAEVQSAAAGEANVLILYPQRLFLHGTPEGHLPDLWQGYDEYRDRLLTFFRRIRLGTGFRFFLDPLTDKIGLNGEVENLVPTTAGFRLDFQSWLQKKYQGSVDDLNQSWGIADRTLPNFTVAARCLPLWYQTKGIPVIYDPLFAKSLPDKSLASDDPARKGQYHVRNTTGSGIHSHFWDDLRQFRLESVRGYMNSIADALKKSVANVPVVYKWTQHSPLFTNDKAAQSHGYDGLGMEAYGHGRALTIDSAAYTYAQAEETPKTTWVIVSGTQESADPTAKETVGYGSKATLFDDWDYLQEIGARGFFTYALQRLPAETNSKVNLAALPDQLDWLAAYTVSVQAAAGHLLTDKPRVLWYPAEAAQYDASIRRLPSGVWWLPSLRPGAAEALGPNLRDYRFAPAPGAENELPTYALWSPHGGQAQAQLTLGKKSQPVFGTAAGTGFRAKDKEGVWTVPVSADPILVGHVSSLPLPLDAVESLQVEAKRLIKVADAQKIPTQNFQSRLFYATNSINSGPSGLRAQYALVVPIIAALTEALRPYAWLEGEQSAKSTFDALVPDLEASGGAYLSLNTDRPPPHPSHADDQGGYHTDYTFTVNAPGSYDIWLAGSPLNTPQASPLAYLVDSGATNEVHDAPTDGPAYAGKFVWSRIGVTTLKRGPHTISIRVLSRRRSDDHYALALDALCLCRVPFHPDGTSKPPIDTTLPPDPSGKSVKETKK